MWASGQELDAEAREAAKKAASKTTYMGPSPALLKRRLAAKKKAKREAAARKEA